MGQCCSAPRRDHAGAGSAVLRNRRALLARAGRVQFPYLIDPNTGVALFESARILDYLEREYAR